MYDKRLFIDEKCLGGIRLKKNWLSKEEVDKAVREVKLPDEPPLKSWTPSNPNLPIMNKYSKVMSSEYWENWIPYTLEEAMKEKSWVDPVMLESEAKRVGMILDRDKKEMLKYLAEGARLGAEGESRLPTSQKNCSSVIEEGAKMADMIQSWLRAKICIGPYDPDDLPWPDCSISPLKAVPKPNGKIRPVSLFPNPLMLTKFCICQVIDMSAPRNVGKLGEGKPLAVNAGIDRKRYPVKMTSSKEWMTALGELGVEALMTKADLNSAYKVAIID